MVVIDSFKAIRDILGDAAALRTFVYDLAVHTAGWGAASLLVGEYTEAEIASEAEFAIADGIIRFTNSRHELTAVREVEVLKLRGADYVDRRPLLRDRRRRARVLPARARPRRHRRGVRGSRGRPVSIPERASTGVAGLDAMLGGGLPRASATIVQGGTGTGKTLLGLQFLLEGARRGEAGIHFTLEETPDQLRGIAHGLGWDLAGVRGARAADAQLRLARRAVDRPLPRSRAAGGGEARGAARRARQPDQHGPRRSLRPALQGARLRAREALPRLRRHARHEHGGRGPAGLRRSCRATESRSPPTT